MRNDNKEDDFYVEAFGSIIIHYEINEGALLALLYFAFELITGPHDS